MIRDEEERPVKKPVRHELGEPLDTLSVEELRSRIDQLGREVSRLEAAIDAKQASRHAAESVFKR